jgi:hypothetical protein
MNRRFFLTSAGGLMLAAPFLPSLAPRTARADALANPRRSIIFHTPCGCLTNRWFPKVEHGPLDASALAGTTLEVLTPFVKKLLVPRGLRAINQYTLPQFIDPHDQAMGSKLTCALIANDGTRYATSHSLDHEIARQLNAAGRDPLVLSVGAVNPSVKTLLSYSAPNVPLLPIVRPAKAYAGLSGLLSGQSAELESQKRRKKSVLDLVHDDLDSYRRTNMSAADQQRISVWLDLVRDTERSLTLNACNESAVGLDAATVAAASESSAAADAFTLGADTMFKLMALSLLCDTNRSLVIHFPSATFNWDGIQHTNDHDGLAHRSGDFTVGGQCLTGVLSMLAEIDHWYAGKFAKLVALLDSLPEGDGTLLDNTATTWLQEFSDGSAFNLNNMPIVIAGSAGGYLKQGVAVNVEGAAIGPGNSEASCADGGTGKIDNAANGSTGGNVPINKLYVTLLNALGCKAPDGGEVTTFGQLDGFTEDSGITNPGELTALKA